MIFSTRTKASFRPKTETINTNVLASDNTITNKLMFCCCRQQMNTNGSAVDTKHQQPFFIISRQQIANFISHARTWYLGTKRRTIDRIHKRLTLTVAAAFIISDLMSLQSFWHGFCIYSKELCHFMVPCNKMWIFALNTGLSNRNQMKSVIL